MLDEYAIGRTPNPDIMCNQEVKFKLFLEAALEDGADLIATGHYAGVRNSFTENASDSFDFRKVEMASFYAPKMKIKIKPTSYIECVVKLWGEHCFRLAISLSQKCAKWQKSAVFFTARKKDSQGICFVGKIGIRDFLKQFIPEQKPGKIINKIREKFLGGNDGAIFYTLGQRHGLNIGGGLPFYVCGKICKLMKFLLQQT